MHHKWLLGSTALVGAGVLFANGAAAQDGFEVTLSGYTEFLFEAADEETLRGGPDRGYVFDMDTEIHVEAVAESDTGITYGSYVELEAGALPMEADEMNLFFSGAFGRFELGRQDGPTDVMVLDATIIAHGTGGVDGDTDNQISAGNIPNTGDATKITYFTPRVAGFQLGASFTPDAGDGNDASTTGDLSSDLATVVETGANWTGALGGFEPGLFVVGTFADVEDPLATAQDEDDGYAFSGGGLIGLGNLDFAASYGYTEEGISGFGEDLQFVLVGVGFEFGPVGVGFHYEYDWLDGDGDFGDGDDANIFVASADYGLLPGVALKGDVSYNDNDPGAGDPGEETVASTLALQVSY